MNCTICDKPLSGGIDTFGDWDAPLCWTCWSEAMALDVTTGQLPNTQITAAIWAADAEQAIATSIMIPNDQWGEPMSSNEQAYKENGWMLNRMRNIER